MKRLTTILFCLVMAISVSAQEQRKFSPEKFQADLEAYITREAHFDQQEAAKYFPLLREMQAKQRAIYARMYKKRNLQAMQNVPRLLPTMTRPTSN